MQARSFHTVRIVFVLLNLLLLFIAAQGQVAGVPARPASIPLCSVDVSVAAADPSLSANESDARYQWLDCSDHFAALPGETGKNFTASANGNYAVRIVKNGCTDTSDCYPVLSLGITAQKPPLDPVIFPNPSNGKFSIDLGASYEDVEVEITNIAGQNVQKNNYGTAQLLSLEIEGENGLYFLLIRTGDRQQAVLKMLKQ